MKRYRSCNARNLNDLIWVTVGGSAGVRCSRVISRWKRVFFFFFGRESEEDSAGECQKKLCILLEFC